MNRRPTPPDEDAVSTVAVPRARGSLPTIPDARKPLASAAARPALPSSPKGGMFAETTAHVMIAEETSRTLGFSRVMAALSGSGTVIAPFLYSKRVLYFPMIATLIALCGASLWMWRRTLAGPPSRAALRAYMSVCVAAGLFIEYDLGVFSPAPLFVLIGVLFFAQANDRRFAIAMPITCAASYFVLALLVLAGVVPDLGLFSATVGSLGIRVVMLMIVPAAFLVASWQARKSWRATLAALNEAQNALRLALTREAQLAEANQNLDVALKAGAGGSGRYTGTLMGHYRLAEVVGRGAMGEVYAATDTSSGKRAAVKVLQASVAREPDLLERFLREGRIAARVSSPHIVTVYDVGGEEGVPYIAMELLEGDDLAAHLRHVERMDLDAVAALVGEVADGLSAAHAEGVVHRDLKPQNIFWAAQGEGRPPVWKILDFGVSKLLDTGSTLTNAAIVGTPGYMSPEQARGGDVDARSDVFSLGAVAYRALTGQPPFRGEMPQILFEIAYVNPVRPSDLADGIPEDVEGVIALALAKEPADRLASALEFASALSAASRGELPAALRERAQKVLGEHDWKTLRRAV